MPKVTKSALEQALRRELALAEPEFRLQSAAGRLSGSVISPTFKGKNDRQRQKMIWDALARVYGPDSVKQIGMLLAYTPEEWTVDLSV